jgi:chaperonin GroEL
MNHASSSASSGSRSSAVDWPQSEEPFYDAHRLLAHRRNQIAENAGEDGAVISGKVLDRDEYNWGFDAQHGEFKDLVKAGIIDPTKVVRTALQHAASVGSLLITTEAMVAERPEKRAANVGPPGGGIGGMGGMGDMDY